MEGKTFSRKEFWKKVDDDAAKKYTVGELLIELAKYPVDATVSILATADCHYIFAGGRNIQLMEEDNHITLFNDEDWDFFERWKEEKEEEEKE